MIKLPIDSSTYFPAAGPQFEGTYWKKNYLFNDRYSLKWFDAGRSFFHYPYMLSNAFNNINTFNYREYHGFPNDQKHILIGDSGGFQIVSYAKKGVSVNIEPIKILRWQEQNCDIGMNLDVPLFDNFSDSLSKSIENFQCFENSRQNYDMILCNVLHGRNYKELTTWYSGVKDFDFDGWAIGVKPADNIYLQIWAYLFLYENNAKGLNNYCHFFGVGSPRTMVALSLLQHKIGLPIGFDASSYNVGSTAREYFLPGDIGKHFYLGSQNSNRLMTGLPCDCPVCRNVSIDNIYEDTGGSGIVICLHNLYRTIETNRQINCIVGDKKNLIRYAVTMFKKDPKIVINIESMINDHIKYGSEYTYNKYKDLFILKSNSMKFENLSKFKTKTFI